MGIGVLAKALKQLEDISVDGVINRAAANKLGITGYTIYRLAQRGDLIKLSRGVYRTNQTIATEEYLEKHEYIAASMRLGPKAFITGPTALAYYSLIDTDPTKIWISVPLSTRSQETLYRLIRTAASPTVGVCDKTGFRIASIERAIVDTLRLQRIFQKEIGFSAALNALRKQETTQQKLLECARKLRAPMPVVNILKLLKPEAFGIQ